MSQYPGTVLSLKMLFSRVSSRCFATTRAPRFLYTALAAKTAQECRSLPIAWPNKAGAPRKPRRRWRHLVSLALIAGGVPACHPTKNDFLSDSGKVPRSKTSALPRTVPDNELTLQLCCDLTPSGQRPNVSTSEQISIREKASLL